MCVFSSGPTIPKQAEPKPTPIPAAADAEPAAAGRRARERAARAGGVRRSEFFGAIPMASQGAPSLAVKTAMGL